MSVETVQAPPARGSLLALLLKIGVSAGLLWLLFARIDAGRLWASARSASLVWLVAALVVYTANVAACVWRWSVLLRAQHVPMSRRRAAESFLVSLFFNNFLPSNIGGDVIRIRDSARPARSKTVATAIVLVDRIIGLMGLVLVAALGATVAAGGAGRASHAWATWLWAGFVLGGAATAPAVLAPDGIARLLKPLAVFHQEWVTSRIAKVTDLLERFRARPTALARCFGGAVFVQASIVVFYVAVAHSLRVPVASWDLAVIVPLSFIVQMLPVSVNGFGVREATFSFYFSRIGLPIESALLLSLVATALIMLFSLSGAAVYVARRH